MDKVGCRGAIPAQPWLIYSHLGATELHWKESALNSKEFLHKGPLLLHHQGQVQIGSFHDRHFRVTHEIWASQLFLLSTRAPTRRILYIPSGTQQWPENTSQ